jgi:lysozyme
MTTLIKIFEGFHAEPYLCPAGIPTIGYGTTIYPNGQKVRLTDPPVTIELASCYLGYDVLRIVRGLDRYILPPNRLEALTSFIYNVGTGAFARSTLKRKLDADPNDPTIADEFLRWDKATVNGKKVVLRGLTRRREAERALWIG